jgi:hypothetical protein
MARDADHARGTSVADFCDSLDPVWLYDRRTIQKKEVSSAFFKFANLPTAQPVMLGDISDIIHDLAGTKAYRNSRSFVEHLRNIGSNHPMEKTFKNAFDANQKNTADFLCGQAHVAVSCEDRKALHPRSDARDDSCWDCD